MLTQRCKKALKRVFTSKQKKEIFLHLSVVTCHCMLAVMTTVEDRAHCQCRMTSHRRLTHRAVVAIFYSPIYANNNANLLNVADLIVNHTIAYGM